VGNSFKSGILAAMVGPEDSGISVALNVFFKYPWFVILCVN
jgi:hypothetical protein